MIFFTRPFRFVLGEEPKGLVRSGLYRYSRNPMCVAVVTAVGRPRRWCTGQRRSLFMPLWPPLFFHDVPVLLEEPYLRRTRRVGVSGLLPTSPAMDPVASRVSVSSGR